VTSRKINVLYINLTTQTFRLENRIDLARYIGGTGLAARLLEETIHAELDPLDPAQPMVIAIGPLNLIMPACTKVVSTFYSPHTGEYGESHAGGRLGAAMRLAGFDALVLTGRARHPLYLVIADKVEFRDARALWNMPVADAGKVLRRFTTGSKVRSFLTIGRAGENMISYACVNVDSHRHFGRLGLGAVMGSKLLKGMVVIGDRLMPIPRGQQNKYRKIYDHLYDKVVNTDLMDKYHEVGTAINIMQLNDINSLPAYNLTASRIDFSRQISGERFACHNLIRKVACLGCPIGCIHIGQLRRQFDRGYEYETVNISYDYELIFALGSFLGLQNTSDILQLIDVVEREGLDAISTGVVLGWATECYKQGIIDQDDTLIPLDFGLVSNYMEAVHYLATAKNDFYRSLGKGVAYASEYYGGSDFACHLGNNEMPGYHTGYGSVVGCAAGSRHSHLDNAGYALDQSRTPIDKMGTLLFEEEVERNILTSMVICLFARQIYTLEVVLECLDAIGMPTSHRELTSLGKDILKTKYDIKYKTGFELANIKIPPRFFATPTCNGYLDENNAHLVLKQYQTKINSLFT
jgi:aldehyde:ferredoxin oxidoreductase